MIPTVRQRVAPGLVCLAGVAYLLGGCPLAGETDETTGSARAPETREPAPEVGAVAQDGSGEYGPSRELGATDPETHPRDPAPAFWLGPPRVGKPLRVASLAPSLTEIVAALGAADRLVAVTRFCTDPAAAGVKRIGGYLDPSLEAVVATRPDLVLVEPSPGNRDVVLRLAELGTPVRVVPLGGVAEVRAAIRVVAGDLELEASGEATLRDFDARLSAVARDAAAKPSRRVALVYGREPLILAGPGSFGDELIRLVGAKNVAGDASTAYPHYPVERLIAAVPDVVIEAFMDGRANRDALEGLADTRHVHVGDDLLVRPGPRLPVAARRLFEVVHAGTPEGMAAEEGAGTQEGTAADEGAGSPEGTAAADGTGAPERSAP